uniref:alpha-1,6-mannosyl-glycoprotein 6-beta-N-acetylglucosaminyltransferase n=1 Tax=Wuchereria bancrofti TaxID=6293 RepID=A0A1I8EC29_WUCBA
MDWHKNFQSVLLCDVFYRYPIVLSYKSKFFFLRVPYRKKVMSYSVRWLMRRGQYVCSNCVVLLCSIFMFANLFTGVLLLAMHDDLKKQECSISEADAIEYPNCREKMQWMEEGWRTHKCYAFYGVNGTSCSFRIYLSEIEKYCPWMALRLVTSLSSFSIVRFVGLWLMHIPLFMERILSGLFKLMFDNELNYKFIRTRITLLWPKWLSAYDELMIKWPEVVSLQRKLNIIMGFLSREAGFKFGQLSSTGGPLGELVQWSDLIAALYLLGHNLMISTEVRTLKKNIKKIDYKCPCPLQDGEIINLLFTDIVGLRYLRGKMKDFFNRMKCKLRILDSFGTHAEFNSRIYFAAHKNSLGGSRKNPWGGFGRLGPFISNIILIFKDRSSVGYDPLVYGKAGYMWKNAKRLIETVRKFTEVHATVSDNLPDFDNLIINHGVLIGPELHALMRKAKIFLGLGFPFEGPAPLEAIANGVVFINPSFNPPKSRKTSDFFKDKPTLRELTSQNPYAELFIRRPHNSSRVEDAIREALRLQDFCYVSRFPPLHAMITVEAVSMQSCQDACCQHNFLCERSFSRIVNMPEFLNKSGSCATLKSMPIPYECSKQENSDLYSCASVPTILDIRRICPCRDFLQGQTALCSSCL